MGVLLRAPDGMDVSSQGNHAQATLMHASIKPPNPMYPTHGDPQCFSNGQCQDGDDWPHCNDDEGPWGYATVGIVVGARFSLNQGSPSYQGGDGTYVTGEAYYFSDSNALDKRDSTNGRGCHPNQDFGCAYDGTGALTCMTQDDFACKCDYDTVNPADYGTKVAQSLFDDANPDHVGFAGSPACDFNNQQPMFQLDYSSCWFEEDNDFLGYLVSAINSMWQQRSLWWNGRLPATEWLGEGYWGWNEVVASGNMETDRVGVADAVVVVIPPLHVSELDDGSASLCFLNQWAIGAIEEDLLNLFDLDSGLQGKPVIIMEQVQGLINDDECGEVWNGEDCEDGFRKSFFSQNFKFESGNCLLVFDQEKDGGDGNVYFHFADDGACDAWDAGVASFCSN